MPSKSPNKELSSFDKRIKKVLPRSWAQICCEWSLYHRASDNPGFTPDHDLEEIYGVSNILAKVNRNQILFVDFDGDVTPAIRSALLKEAVVFIQRSCYFYAMAMKSHDGCKRKFLSVNLYQSALFSARSINSFFGISYVRRPQSSGIIIDVMAGGKEHKPTWGKSGPKVLMFDAHASIGHKESWKTLQRILSKSEIPKRICPSSIVNQLSLTEPGCFSFERNQFHYRPTGWPVPELICSHFENLNLFDTSEITRLTNLNDTQSDSFIPHASTILVEIGLKLLSDLSQENNAFNDDYEIAYSWYGYAKEFYNSSLNIRIGA